jgi:hypothetical protein
MKMIYRAGLIGCVAIALSVGRADAKRPTTRPSSSWAPAVSDAPANRVGGAARGCRADPGLLVSLLAPRNAVGKTVQSQPTLYWYITKKTDRPVEITLTPCGPDGRDIGADPVLDVVIPKIETAGIQALSLAKPPGADQAPVSLEVGKQYSWVVEVVVHDLNGSDNPNATTRLQRVKAPSMLAGVESAPPEDQYAKYQQCAMWYDMLDRLNHMIDSEKDNSVWRDTRRELLSAQDLIEANDGSITEKVRQD